MKIYHEDYEPEYEISAIGMLVAITAILAGIALMLSGCASPSATSSEDYTPAICATLALHTQSPTPAPSPEPQPGDTCTNCDGTGILGDGRTKITCPKCKGTGKIGSLPVTEQHHRQEPKSVLSPVPDLNLCICTKTGICFCKEGECECVDCVHHGPEDSPPEDSLSEGSLSEGSLSEGSLSDDAAQHSKLQTEPAKTAVQQYKMVKQRVGLFRYRYVKVPISQEASKTFTPHMCAGPKCRRY